MGVTASQPALRECQATMPSLSKAKAKTNTNTNSSAGWISVVPVPRSQSVTSLNDSEFLIWNKSNKRHGLVKYNVLCDEWTCYLQPLQLCFVSESVHQHRDAMQLDRVNNRFFFVCIDYDEDIAVEYMKTSIVDVKSGLLILREFSYESHPHKCQHAMVNVNGKMHKMGRTHTIWDDTSRKWEPIKGSPAFLKDSHPNFQRISLFHVSSRGFVLMFGGKAGIWKYCTQSGLWKEIKVQRNKPLRLDYAGSHVTMSANERFAIIAPNSDVNKHFQVLNIADGDQHKLWESSIVVPDHLELIANSGGPWEEQKTQSLVFGWIRKQVKRQFVPLVLDGKLLINKWCSMEMIHCFVIDEEGQWSHIHKMIPLASILCSKL